VPRSATEISRAARVRQWATYCPLDLCSFAESDITDVHLGAGIPCSAMYSQSAANPVASIAMVSLLHVLSALKRNFPKRRISH